MKRSLNRLVLAVLFGVFLAVTSTADGQLAPCFTSPVASIGHVLSYDPGGCGGGGGGC